MSIGENISKIGMASSNMTGLTLERGFGALTPAIGCVIVGGMSVCWGRALFGSSLIFLSSIIQVYHENCVIKY